MILLIDWGNTYLKYLLVEDALDEKSKFGVEKIQQTPLLESLIEVISKHNKNSTQIISKAYISSVRKSEDNQSLSVFFNKLKVQSFFAKVASEFSGVVCAYDQVDRLGIDRWLTILAGFSSEKTTGIIDIGSAITLDVVNKQGLHLGGQIVPGNRLLLESLNATDRIVLPKETVLPKDAKNKNNVLLGTSTKECVSVGINKMLQSYIECSISDVTNQHQVERWILTGGGGEYWTNELSISNRSIVYDELLVFKGLIKFKNQLRE
jgi:type III pantothenate kinase